MQWLDTLLDRISPTGEVTGISGPALAALVLALVIVGEPAIWHRVRLAVTLVHELGHALVGVAVGRRFSGFVLRADASGHAITSGPPRGPGIIATTWAGYPAPALLGAAMVWLSYRGWAAPLLSALLLILVAVLTRVRSLLTGVVAVAALAGVGMVWWWRDDELQSALLVAAGLVLIAGAWRHLAAVARRRAAGSDPAQLARLTHLPAALWMASFTLALAGASWVAALALWPGVRELF